MLVSYDEYARKLQLKKDRLRQKRLEIANMQLDIVCAEEAIATSAPTAEPQRTPVTRLAELQSSKCIHSVEYEDITALHLRLSGPFVYRVLVIHQNKTLVSIGGDTTKKNAKHAAAELMLVALNQLNSGLFPLLPMTATSSPGDSHPVAALRATTPSTPKLQATTPWLPLTPATPTPTVPFTSSTSSTKRANPIAALQEHLQARAQPLPKYEDVEFSGPPHDRQFTASCEVANHLELGTASTKRIAKQVAAHNMCVHMQLY